MIQLAISFIAGLLLIVILTAKYGVAPFFALFVACFVVGLGVQMPLNDIVTAMKEGFGSTMKSLGLLIVMGTTLGALLEYTGSTKVMAAYILKAVGERHTALAMSITGFVVGLPIFCDSGYIVLSGLNHSLSKRTGIPMLVLSVCLATGLYSVHCLIPPHPGISAAAGTIGVDLGKLIGWGLIVAIPAMVIGYAWTNYAAKKIAFDKLQPVLKEEEISVSEVPSVFYSFIPVIVPIALIAVKSFLPTVSDHFLYKILFAIGNPVIALTIGVLLTFMGMPKNKGNRLKEILQNAIERSGSILIIIGAGGAFGAVLAATKIGSQFAAVLPLNSLGILFPFLIAFILKTAQGSSTVAIITAASIVQPFLPVIGLASPAGNILAVLAMGAGSMMISHANDAYFWVIAKFSGLEMKPMLKVYSVATMLMGITAMIMIYILSLII